MISPLSRSDASARAAVARSCALRPRDRFLERGRQQRVFAAAMRRSCDGDRAPPRPEPQDRERQDRRENRHNGRQPEQGVGAGVHWKVFGNVLSVSRVQR